MAYVPYLTNMISIHALRVEGDRGAAGGIPAEGYFYPRPPGGGRLHLHGLVEILVQFLSTPSGWRATETSYLDAAMELISIHALRVEGDQGRRLAELGAL